MPLSADWVAGKVGYVLAAGNHIDDNEGNQIGEPNMGEWQFPAEAVFVPRNAFKNRGYQEGVSGFKKVRFTIKGPLAKGDLRFILGNRYFFWLGIDSADFYEFYAEGIIVGMRPINNAETGPEIELVCESVGLFTISTLGEDQLLLGELVQ